MVKQMLPSLGLVPQWPRGGFAAAVDHCSAQKNMMSIKLAACGGFKRETIFLKIESLLTKESYSKVNGQTT